jgi:hypothetical protein
MPPRLGEALCSLLPQAPIYYADLDAGVLQHAGFQADQFFDLVEASGAIAEFEASEVEFADGDALGTVYADLYPSLDDTRKQRCFARVCTHALRLHRFSMMGALRRMFGNESSPTMKSRLTSMLDGLDPDKIVHGHGVIPNRYSAISLSSYRFSRVRPMAAELLKPEQINDFARPGLGRLTHCYGGLVTLNAQGRVATKGSMVLARTDHGHLVFTANHVADSLQSQSGVLVVRPQEITAEAALNGVEHSPLTYPISAQNIAWSSGDIDVAAFHAPAELVQLSHLRWFDAAESAAATKSIRRLQSNSEHSLLTFIMGCPNYGHFRESDHETISFLTMMAYISALPAEPWDGLSRAPQVHLEIEDGSKREQPEQQGTRGRLQAALRDATAKTPRLGGFSGGPIVVIGSDGEFLMGLVTEGHHIFGTEARAAGVAWDDIMFAYTRGRAG